MGKKENDELQINKKIRSMKHTLKMGQSVVPGSYYG